MNLVQIIFYCYKVAADTFDISVGVSLAFCAIHCKCYLTCNWLDSVVNAFFFLYRVIENKLAQRLF
jgi:hypothetical protein